MAFKEKGIKAGLEYKGQSFTDCYFKVFQNGFKYDGKSIYFMVNGYFSKAIFNADPNNFFISKSFNIAYDFDKTINIYEVALNWLSTQPYFENAVIENDNE